MSLLRSLVPSVVVALVAISAGGCSIAAHRDFASVAPAPRLAAESGTGKSTSWSALEVASEVPPADLSAMLTRKVEQHGLPGVAAVVVRGGRVVAEGVAGIRRRGDSTPITIADQFEIASGAKAMSAVLIARLIEEGVLDWDRPASGYFPGEGLAPEWDKVTLRHLITHTAGLREPWITFAWSASAHEGTLMDRRGAFVRRVLDSPPASPPGVRFAYRNIDYVLAGVLAEKVTGIPWETLMYTRVFAPLGLRSAGYGPPGRPGETQQPWGHGKFRVFHLGIFGKYAFDPGAAGADYPAIGSPAGYVHLSVHDWAKFVALHLKAHPANPNRTTAWLRPETFAILQGMDSPSPYAGGWFLGTRPWAKGARPADSGRVLFHEGNNGRWTSFVWLAPEKDLALLIVCNQGDQRKAIDEIASQLVGSFAALPRQTARPEGPMRTAPEAVANR